MKLMIPFLSLCIVFSCSSELSRFRACSNNDTIESYNKYLLGYPNSPYADSARIKIEHLQYKNAVKAGTIEAMDNFLQISPDGLFADSAKAKIETLVYAKCINGNGWNAIEDFLNDYPHSKYAKYAHEEIITRKYKEALAVDDSTLYASLLRDYRNHYLASDAKNRLEEICYKSAITSNSKAAYENYLKIAPESNRYQDIEYRYKNYLFDEATKNNDVSSFVEIIKRFERDSLSDKSRQRILETIQPKDFNVVGDKLISVGEIIQYARDSKNKNLQNVCNFCVSTYRCSINQNKKILGEIISCGGMPVRERNQLYQVTDMGLRPTVPNSSRFGITKMWFIVHTKIYNLKSNEKPITLLKNQIKLRVVRGSSFILKPKYWFEGSKAYYDNPAIEDIGANFNLNESAYITLLYERTLSSIDDFELIID